MVNGHSGAIYLGCLQWDGSAINKGLQMYSTWTKEKVIKLALSCGTREEFKKRFPSAYRFAWRNNFLQDVYAYIDSDGKTIWTEEKIKAEAEKYPSRSSFAKHSNGAYRAARDKGILDKVCEHMKSRKKHA